MLYKEYKLKPTDVYVSLSDGDRIHYIRNYVCDLSMYDLDKLIELFTTEKEERRKANSEHAEEFARQQIASNTRP